jgi:hypothetical protein
VFNYSSFYGLVGARYGCASAVRRLHVHGGLTCPRARLQVTTVRDVVAATSSRSRMHSADGERLTSAASGLARPSRCRSGGTARAGLASWPRRRLLRRGALAVDAQVDAALAGTMHCPAAAPSHAVRAAIRACAKARPGERRAER